MTNIAIPTRLYYPLSKALKELRFCADDENDIIHLGALGALEVCHYFKGGFNVYSISDEKGAVEDKSIGLGGRYCSLNISTMEYSNLSILNGLFKLDISSLRDFEFSDGKQVSDITVSTPNNNISKKVKFSFVDKVIIDKEKMYITADEITRLTGKKITLVKGKSFVEPDSPKTIAKKSEMIPALLRMIPELSDVDIDTESPSKIKNIIEAIAAEKGIDMPPVHHQTWEKYLGRK
ncbi:hypothetical protein [Serratia ureilytica]|uniref:hypothetical protein n=1 Tax=Serratia ureilytica TaxID=300181 RepID=UPI0033145CDF